MQKTPSQGMQEAKLIINNAAQTVLATVQVPAFPDSPDLLEWDNQFFAGPNIGYKDEHLTYIKQTVYKVAKNAD